MKYAIFGDIHANLEAFRAVLEECQRLGVDDYICIGDVVGYNANPRECLDLVRELDPALVVRGNHDEQAG
jgi:predicted phosphodiesterase